MAIVKDKRRLLIAVAAGIAVDAVALAAFGLYTWTAIHSGWSEGGLGAFMAATIVVPAALGFVTGWFVYRHKRAA